MSSRTAIPEVLDASVLGEDPERYDVVVVGFGIAGGCAALEAARALGADGRVLLLERAAVHGGTSSMSGGHFYLGGGTAVQRATGHEDSAEAMAAYLMASTKEPDEEKIRAWIKEMREELHGVDKLLTGQTIWVNRLKDVGWIGVEGCIALGITGPLLRAAGLPWDLRKTQPYLGYETFDFEVPTDDRGDCWSRYVVRVAEMWESLRIVEQLLKRLEPGPTMIDDPKIAWPAKLSLGPDGMGNSLEHVQKIMNGSMESLIHHFKLVTEGFRVPPGQVYTKVESPRGELGAHVISDGGTRPYRVHFREPSFDTPNIHICPWVAHHKLAGLQPKLIDICHGQLVRARDAHRASFSVETAREGFAHCIDPSTDTMLRL